MSSLRLHLGCGKRYIPGYIHIDINNYPHVDFPGKDVRDLSFINNNSVELIYASHVLEYFGIDEVIGILLEWKRVLKVGGILRVAVPDGEALLSVYKKGREKEKEIVRRIINGKWETSTGMIYHKMIYTHKVLELILNFAGFKNIGKWNWRNIFVGELRGYDDYSKSYIPHLDFNNGTLISLNMEVDK